MSEAVRLLWKHQTGDESVAVAITDDGEYVVGGSHDGHVYFFRRDGTLLWRYKVAEGKVFRLAVSAGAQRIAVGTLGGKYITVLDRDGQLVWQKPAGAQTWAGAAISADGEVICGGADDGMVRLWSGVGQLVWEFQAEHKFVRPVRMTPDGGYIVFSSDDGAAVGLDDNYVYMLDHAGHQLWKYMTEEEVWSGARITPDGEYVVAGSSDDHIYLFDKRGQVLWRHEVAGDISDVDITPDGQYIVAGSTDDHVYLLNQSGQLLWKYRTGDDVYGVASSVDGQFIVAASDDHCVYLFNAEGEVLFRYETQNKAYDVAITPNGRYFAIGSRDHHIYMFENLLAPEEAIITETPAVVARRVIRRVRQAYINNPYLGLCQWFEEFDRHVVNGHLVVCEELIREAREQDYPFTSQEWGFVDSREGVLWLRRGISYQQSRDFDQATACYEHSLKIHKRLKHPAAQGQVEMALSLLTDEKRTGQREPFLEVMAKELTALGGSSALLCGRLNSGDVEEHRQILRAAMQLRLTRPLAQAAQSMDERMRMIAMAALGRFRQLAADQINVQLSGLQDPHWFVRWRAADALGQRQENAGESVLRLARALECEADPEVQRALALSLGNIGDRRATPALTSALADTDADVRWAASIALSRVGDRRALPYLRDVADGKDFLGRSVQEAAQEAVGKIEERYPLPKVQELRACRFDPAEPALRPASVFWAGESVVLIARISGALPDTRLRMICVDERGSRVFEQEERYTELQARAKVLRAVLERSSNRPEPVHLVELIDGAPSTSRTRPTSGFEVGMRVRCVRDGASGRTELRAGDIGTVRATGGHSPIGVEWDRDIGGHDGNVKFTCPRGHGWFVKENEIELAAGDGTRVQFAADTISFEVPPPLTKRGDIGQFTARLEFYDRENERYEHGAEVAFRTIWQVKISNAVICLEVDSASRPLHPTPVITTTSPFVYCSAHLTDAPVGTEVTTTIRGPDNSLVVCLDKRTETEGEQDVAFRLEPGKWLRGDYSLEIQTRRGNLLNREFRVVEDVSILQMATCRSINDQKWPIGRTTIFSASSDAVYCYAELSEAPPQTQILAEWAYLEQGRSLIRSCIAMLEAAGAQCIAFSLSRPKGGWPLGRYEVRLAVFPPGKPAIGGKPDSAPLSVPESRWQHAAFTVA